ncbi:MAG: hypothetical protein AB1Z98_10485, partial [Nannocystaceae bacterium]
RDIQTTIQRFWRRMTFFEKIQTASGLAFGAAEWVANNGYDKLFGARPMARLIDEKIKEQLVDELLFGALERGGTVHVDVDTDKDELTFAFEANEPPPEDGPDDDVKVDRHELVEA